MVMCLQFGMRMAMPYAVSVTKKITKKRRCRL